MSRQQEDKYTRRRLRTSYFSTLISMALVLFMLGLIGLIVLHAKKLSDHVKENIGFSIIMKEGVKEVDIIQLQKTLDATKYVKSTEYITKEKAAEDLKNELGEDFIGFLGFNPLHPCIEVRFKADYANNDSIALFKEDVLKNSNVGEVSYPPSLIREVNENLSKISFILLVFSGLLLLIAIALINNTIRLSVFSKRFLIKSMQLVGATERFIRKPFIVKGFLQGIYGAFIAIILLCGILYLAQKELPEIVNLQDIDIFLTLFGIVIMLGMIISWVSNFFAVRKYLKIKTDYLYYH